MLRFYLARLKQPNGGEPPMRLRNSFTKATFLVLAFLLVSVPVGYAKPQEYSFKVHNVGKNTILKLMASEDGKRWGYFNIGDGIDPGETRTIVWDKSTNNQSCMQYFKAAFDDGQESPPKKFDFCEQNLEIDVR
jgi:hypothetical protein